MCRVVKRREVAAEFNLGEDILVDKGAGGEELTSLHDAVSHRVDVFERFKHSVIFVSECGENELHADLMVRNGYLLLDLVFAGGLVCQAAHGKAYLFNQAFGDDGVHIVILHVEKLVLDGRASAIDYENYHILLLL